MLHMGSLSVYIVYDCTLDFTEFISQLEIQQNKVTVCFIHVCNDYYRVHKEGNSGNDDNFHFPFPCAPEVISFTCHLPFHYYFCNHTSS